MKKKLLSVLLVLSIAATMVACGSKEEVQEEPAVQEVVEEVERGPLDLEDGVYTVEFTTDSPMFHLNETCDGIANMTVENGFGTVHITLASTHIVNLYVGVVADAENDEANWLQPTTDEVTYEDGTTEEVYGFDVPVSVIDEEFDLALIGTKGTWYDHKVKVSNPTLVEE